LKDDSFYTQAADLTKKLKKTEPFNRGLLEYDYQLAILKDKKEDALAIVTNGLNDFRWDVSLFERAMDLNVQLGEQHWPTAMALYNRFLSQEAHLLTLPKGQLPGAPFAVTSPIRASIGQIYFKQAKYAEALEMLKPGLTDTLAAPIDKIVARYYLASLQKTQQDDPTLTAKLIASDATEKDKLAQLVGQ
jgi:tetratricopeptide (TPR) repeat protein